MALLVLAGLAAVAWRHRQVKARAPAEPDGAALDAAIVEARARVAQDPDDLAARVRLGLLFYRRGGDYSVDAINALEKARDLGSADPALPRVLGLLYQSQGLLPFAEREFERYRRAHPGQKEAELLLAKAVYQSGRYREAADRYAALRRLWPTDPVVLENLGLSRLAAGDYDAAVEALSALKGLGGPASRRASYFLGDAYLGARSYREALAAFGSARAGGDAPPPGLTWAQIDTGSALALDGMGLSDKAAAAWNRVLAEDPANSEARERVGAGPR